MPTYALIAIFILPTYLALISIEFKIIIILLSFISTFAIPMLTILFMRSLKLITNLQLTTPKERRIPYFITFVGFVFISYNLLSNQYPIPTIIVRFFVGSSVAVFLGYIVNLKWKISAHAIGSGGVTALLFALAVQSSVSIHLAIVISILLSGIIGSSRMVVQAHNQWQIFAGWLLGLLLYFALLFIYKLKLFPKKKLPTKLMFTIY